MPQTLTSEVISLTMHSLAVGDQSLIQGYDISKSLEKGTCCSLLSEVELVLFSLVSG